MQYGHFRQTPDTHPAGRGKREMDINSGNAGGNGAGGGLVGGAGIGVGAGATGDSGAFDEWTLMARMGMSPGTVDAETAIVSMPVTGNVQPFGSLHGGASAALAETAGSLAAQAHAATLGDGWFAAGVDLSITHLQAVDRGMVTAVARAVHLGGSSAVYEIDVIGAAGERVAVARLTCRMLNRE